MFANSCFFFSFLKNKIFPKSTTFANLQKLFKNSKNVNEYKIKKMLTNFKKCMQIDYKFCEFKKCS